MLFYIGTHRPARADDFERCMVSVNKLRGRASDFPVREWVMDSGAFTEVATHGGYRWGPEEYAAQVDRWARCGRLVAAVSQDFMCEDFALAKTGLTLREHQLLTVERYQALARAVKSGAYVMPVLQGYAPREYVTNLRDYGALLPFGAWVGVGSVCKRNAHAASIEDVLVAIHRERPDLRLHGFGVKFTALASNIVRALLYSADSMAWSLAARRERRPEPNSHDHARQYIDRVEKQGHNWQPPLFIDTGRGCGGGSDD